MHLIQIVWNVWWIIKVMPFISQGDWFHITSEFTLCIFALLHSSLSSIRLHMAETCFSSLKYCRLIFVLEIWNPSIPSLILFFFFFCSSTVNQNCEWLMKSYGKVIIYHGMHHDGGKDIWRWSWNFYFWGAKVNIDQISRSISVI